MNKTKDGVQLLLLGKEQFLNPTHHSSSPIITTCCLHTFFWLKYSINLQSSVFFPRVHESWTSVSFQTCTAQQWKSRGAQTPRYEILGTNGVPDLK